MAGSWASSVAPISCALSLRSSQGRRRWHNGGLVSGALASVDERFFHRHAAERPTHAELPHNQDDLRWTVDDFRNLMADSEHKEAEHHEEPRRAAAAGRRQRVNELIEHHVSDENWRALLHQARQAAEHRQKEYMLLRFPNQLCGDGGRAINAAEPDWPATLRGEGAEIYLRWERDLKARGFHLAARVLEFPGGMPGDIGLFLIWGE